MFTEDANSYEVGSEKMCKPYQLMTSKVPHPMTALECADTYTSEFECRLQLAEAARVANAGSKAALELWKRGNHKCKLFCVDDFPIIAVHFGSVRQLGSTKYEPRTPPPSRALRKHET
jgi:hypothetical protein